MSDDTALHRPPLPFARVACAHDGEPWPSAGIRYMWKPKPRATTLAGVSFDHTSYSPLALAGSSTLVVPIVLKMTPMYVAAGGRSHVHGVA